jgi:hypothetical protein
MSLALFIFFHNWRPANFIAHFQGSGKVLQLPVTRALICSKKGSTAPFQGKTGLA